MKQILSMQWFQLKRDKWLWISMLLVFVLECLVAQADMNMNLDYVAYNGSLYAATDLYLNYFIAAICELIAVASIMGKDYTDKTINYEILHGYSRDDSFWGRSVPAILTGVFAALLSMVVPIFYISLRYGWGAYISVSGLVLRLALFAIVSVRLCCELVFISVLVKKTDRIYIVSGLLAFLELALMASEVKFAKISYFLLGDILFYYDFTSIFHLDGTYEIQMVDVLDIQNVMLVVGISIAIGAGCILAARSFFRRDDM
jgi:ABC-type transport system involved in multi-copper enzyme maturation permease subunit